MPRKLGDQKLREWIERYAGRLINLSAAICRDRHRAEEIVQEAFVKLWQNPPTAGEVAYPSWLRRVVTNLSINALQRTRRAEPLPDGALGPAAAGGSAPDEQCDHDERVERVHSALSRLDASKRAILVLRAYEQLSYEEIADHLGVPVGTVMSRLNRARGALMDEMRRDARGTDDPAMVFDIRKYRRA